jgi:hypothetical protein
MSTYDAQTGWNELGATKTGVQITVNNGEEQFDVDQIYGNIASEPTDWDYEVSTSLAETTLQRLQIAWEGAPITTDTVGSGNEYVSGYGNPRTYTERRLAVLHQRKNGKIRAYIFRKVNRAPQESTISHNKTGDQLSIPVKFTALPDLSIADERSRVLVIRDQV